MFKNASNAGRTLKKFATLLNVVTIIAVVASVIALLPMLLEDWYMLLLGLAIIVIAPFLFSVPALLLYGLGCMIEDIAAIRGVLVDGNATAREEKEKHDEYNSKLSEAAEEFSKQRNSSQNKYKEMFYEDRVDPNDDGIPKKVNKNW